MPRRMPFLVAALVAGATGVAGCGGSGSDAKGEAAATPSAGAQTANGCRRVRAPAPKGEGHLAKPTTRLAAGRTWVATVATSCGTFEITLDVKGSPRTSASFASLAGKHFYDGTTFHRVVPNFVIQGGDPKGDGTGGPGYSVVEPPPRHVHYRVGDVAMAKTQYEPSGTSGSQFFVVTGSSSQFAPEYAVLGRVTGGQDTVDRIASAKADPTSGAPQEPIVIDSIRVAAR
jgi:cyclophilin family peptidyl-prolyl cis-trans isomerase